VFWAFFVFGMPPTSVRLAAKKAVIPDKARRAADPGPPEAHAFTRRSRIFALRARPG
jgi:hypothetical protein